MEFVRHIFVKATRVVERFQSPSPTRSAGTLRFRPGIAAFTFASFALIVNMFLTPQKDLTDEEVVGLFLKERVALKRESERQYKMLRYEYLRNNRDKGKYFEHDLTQAELDMLHEEAIHRAKEVLRKRLEKEEEWIEKEYNGWWNAVKRSVGIKPRPLRHDDVEEEEEVGVDRGDLAHGGAIHENDTSGTAAGATGNGGGGGGGDDDGAIASSNKTE